MGLAFRAKNSKVGLKNFNVDILEWSVILLQVVNFAVKLQIASLNCYDPVFC